MREAALVYRMEHEGVRRQARRKLLEPPKLMNPPFRRVLSRRFHMETWQDAREAIALSLAAGQVYASGTDGGCLMPKALKRCAGPTANPFGRYRAQSGSLQLHQRVGSLGKPA